MGISEKIHVTVTADDQASGVFKGIGGALGGIGKFALGLAGGAAVAGLAGLGAGLKIAIDEGMEADLVSAQLNATLKSTGGAAGVTADMAQDLAGNLQGLTMFSDDAVLSGENMLLTFTNIGKDIFPDATETMLDLSQAMGQDIKSSAVQLGKALNDPITGMSALSRVGVTFTEEQKAMIKGLQESGDLMGAQKIILAELQKEFGGSAQAAGQTFGGQLAILKNNLLNVAESAGTALIPVLTTGLQSITPVITELATKLAEFLQSEGFKAFLADVATFISETLVPAIIALIDWLSTYLPPIIKAVGEYWTTYIAPVLRDFIEWLQVNLPPAIQAVSDFWNAYIKPALEWLVDTLTTYVFPALKTLGEWLGENIPRFLKTLRDAWERDFGGIRSIFETLWANLKEAWEAIKALFSGDFEAFGEHIRNIFDNSFALIKDLLGRAWEAIKNIDWGEVGRNIVEGIANGITAFADWAITAIINLGGAVIDAIRGFLGISSPSSVMADLVGKPMAQGLAVGFRAALPDLSSEISSMVAATEIPLALAGGRGNMLQGALNGQPTIIAPVINYQPWISTASQREAETKIKPMIGRLIRDYLK